jgi:membrane protein implicated in regulation of membrane protease activity
MTEWFTVHAAGVSLAVFTVCLVIVWWRWRRRLSRDPRAHELPPMSSPWRGSRDRYRNRSDHV